MAQTWDQNGMSPESNNGEDHENCICTVCQLPWTGKDAVRLPCSHIFCFICVKGVASRKRLKKQCPTCRRSIPPSYFKYPDVVERENIANRSGYTWFYEAGKDECWWRYDAKTVEIIEQAYQEREPSVEILVCGHIYIVNFELRVQIRKDMKESLTHMTEPIDPKFVRIIKRDHHDIGSCIGIAGLRFPASSTNICEDKGIIDDAAAAKDKVEDTDQPDGVLGIENSTASLSLDDEQALVT